MKKRLKILLLTLAGLLLTLAIAQVSIDKYNDSVRLNESLHTVVKIYSANGSGSGVIIAPRFILTASHVVNGSPRVLVDIYDGNGCHRTIPGLVTKIDTIRDLALVMTDERLKQFSIIGVKAAEQLHPGDSLYCAGFACSRGLSLTRGYFAGRSTNEDHPLLWQASAVAFFGCSGGAIFSDKGYLVGILTTAEGPCVDYFVPAQSIEAFLN